MWSWLRTLWPGSAASGDRGRDGEALAERHLRSLGCRILERRHRNRGGELDLVVLDGETVVFVEVKTRTGNFAGHPSEAVTLDKRRRLTAAALVYLKRRGWLGRRVRFDVISVTWTDDGVPPRVEHFRAAFEAPGFGQMW